MSRISRAEHETTLKRKIPECSQCTDVFESYWGRNNPVTPMKWYESSFYWQVRIKFKVFVGKKILIMEILKFLKKN